MQSSLVRARNQFVWLGIIIFGTFSVGGIDSAIAQIEPDDTLGGERSQVTRDVLVRGSRGDRIDGGARRGGNLFHSFRDFNVRNGERIYFANPPEVENIFSRVTGGNVSRIFGTLGVNGVANLFLLNPNGIIFGPNARLDIRGAFLGSTADKFLFADGSEFSAVDPQASSLLTINVPTGLQYGSNPGAITINGSILEVDAGKTFALLGGDIQIEEADLWIPGGQIELGSIKNGTVVLMLENGLLNFGVSGGIERGSINIVDTFLDTSADSKSSGNITINSGFLTIIGSDLASESFDNYKSGNILFNADNILLDNSYISNSSDYGGGNIEINANSFSAINETLIETTAFDSGSSGDIIINVRDTAEFDSSSVFTDFLGVDGSGGNIEINVGSLLLGNTLTLDNGRKPALDASTSGQGNSGEIVINALESIRIENFDIRNEVNFLGIGNANNIKIVADDLLLTNGANLSTITYGRGDAGDIIIDVRDSVAFRRSSALSLVGRNAVGNGGDIRINANSLSVNNPSLPSNALSFLSTDTNGHGNAGNIFINTRNSVYLGAVVSTVVRSSGEGNGGDIEINTGNFFADKAGILSGVDLGGLGDSGNVTVNARNEAIFSDGGVYTNTGGRGGSGGDIRISARSLSVINGAQLFASTYGQGRSGNIFINASDNILIDGFRSYSGRSSSLSTTTEAEATGQGGNITVNTSSFRISNSGLVSALTSSSESGGNVVINADAFEAYRGGQVVTSTQSSGHAGNITLNVADRIVLDGVDPTYDARLEANNGKVRPDNVGGVDAQGAFSGLYADAEGGATGRGGNIRITTGALTVQNQGLIAVNSRGTGQAGTLNIDANSVALDNQAQLTAATESSSGGNINLRIADRLSLDNDSTISASTTTGQGGSLTLNVDQSPTNIVEVSGNSSLAAQATGTGNAGSVSLNTRALTVQDQSNISATTTSGRGGSLDIAAQTVQLDGAQISASTQTGQAGSLQVNAAESVNISNGGRLAVEAEQGGTSGTLSINTDQLNLQNGAEASVRSTGLGQSGSLDITARNVQLDNDAQITATTESGVGGNITLRELDRLNIRNSQISASTQTGQAGSLLVNATESIDINNGGRLAVEAEKGGTAGALSINTDQLNLQNGAQVSVSSTLAGQSGNLDINAQDVQLSERSAISAETQAGAGGNLSLQVGDSLRLADQSTVSASTQSGQGGSLTLNLDHTPTNTVDLAGGSRIETEAETTGNAGRLNLNTSQLTLNDGSTVSASTISGQGGNVTLQELDRLNIRNSAISASTQTGEAGNVDVNAQGGIVEISGALPDGRPGGLLVRATGDGGNAGELTVRTGQLILEDGGEISGSVTTGQGGDISINATESININNGGRLTGEAGDRGTAGTLSINTDRLNLQNGAQVSVSSTQSGQSGNLDITAQTVQLNNGAQVTAETELGGGGNIDLQISNMLQLDQGSRISASTINGKGGNLTLNADRTPANRVELGHGSQIETEASGAGNAGRLNLHVEQLTVSDGSGISASTISGEGGDIVLRGLDRLRVSDSEISASTRTGEAGDISVNAQAGVVEISGTLPNGRPGGLLVRATGDGGNAGDITVRTRHLSIEDGAQISGSVTTGQGGDINILASESVQIEDRGRLSAEARRGGTAGNLSINTDRLNLQDRARISVSSTASGQSGNLDITAQTVQLNDRSQITATTESGEGGDITLQVTDALQLDQGSIISASTENGGGGTLRVNVDRDPVNSVTLNNSRITTEATRRGAAGNLRINARQLSLQGQNAAISASTRSGTGGGVTLQGLDTLEIDDGEVTASTRTGRAGNVNINANESIELRNGGRLAVEAIGRGGIAGDLNLTADEFALESGSAVTVSSQRGQAGNLTVNADVVRLNQGQITAETAESGRNAGANINLNSLDLLLLRNNSQISANARESANGGNVGIDAYFIFANPFEDSDIRANALAGDGGRIEITTQGLFGLQPAEASIPGISDITASSESGVQGVIEINNPNTNPTRSLEFSDAPPEPPQVAQECSPTTELDRDRSSFVIVGRGGLPSSPYDILGSEDLWQDWRLTEVATETRRTQPTFAASPTNAQSPTIIEAQGWVRDTAGQVELVAAVTNSDPPNPTLLAPACSTAAQPSRIQSGEISQ